MIAWEEEPDKADETLWNSLDDVVMYMWGAAVESLEEPSRIPLELTWKDFFCAPGCFASLGTSRSCSWFVGAGELTA